MKGIMDDMLIDIKSLLSGFDFVNTYDGYQVIAEIWKDSLTEDIELIGQSDFYTVARTRIPKMVTKGTGSNKREEQEGWISSLIPSELIIEQLFSDQASKIDSLKQGLSDTELELDELVEAAKVEDTEEYDVLFECITKNKEGEAGNSFTAKAIKDELKKYKKDTEEYNLLKKAEKLMEDKSKYSKDIREKEKELKEEVEERILTLTEKEIDSLVYEKWFGHIVEDMVNLIRKPLEEELDTLKQLKDRYSSTLSDLDKEYNELGASFENMLSELVVIE